MAFLRRVRTKRTEEFALARARAKTWPGMVGYGTGEACVAKYGENRAKTATVMFLSEKVRDPQNGR